MASISKIKVNNTDYDISATLSTATSSSLGGVMVGNNLSITTAGKLNAVDTTYTTATTSKDGLMSSADKVKLNGIATGANNYSLPTATSSVLGGIKVGSNLSISSGLLSVPNASSTTAGAVKLVNNLTTTASGSALDAYQGYALNNSLSTVSSSVSTLSTQVSTLMARPYITDVTSATFTSTSTSSDWEIRTYSNGDVEGFGRIYATVSASAWNGPYGNVYYKRFYGVEIPYVLFPDDDGTLSNYSSVINFNSVCTGTGLYTTHLCAYSNIFSHADIDLYITSQKNESEDKTIVINTHIMKRSTY